MVDMQVFYPAGCSLENLLCHSATVDKNKRFFSSNKPGKGSDPAIRVEFNHKLEFFFGCRRGYSNQLTAAPPTGEPEEHFIRVPYGRRKTDTLDGKPGNLVKPVKQDPEMHTPL